MLDNLTGLKCESCNSHIQKYKQDDSIIIECSHCGIKVEELSSNIILDDLNEEENMYMW